MSENYITPLNNAISTFNSLIIDYIYSLTNIQNKYILITKYIPNVNYYYINNNNEFVLCGDEF